MCLRKEVYSLSDLAGRSCNIPRKAALRMWPENMYAIQGGGRGGGWRLQKEAWLWTVKEKRWKP